MADKENTRIKEARMCITQKEFENLQKEAKECGLSISDYMRIMIIFGKKYIWGFSKENFWVVLRAEARYDDFLFKKEQEFERGAKRENE